MKKNAKLESIRKRIPADVKLMVDHSFAVIERIDKIMTEKGISQRELAERLGKRESEVSKWMRGTQNFTFKTIAKLEVALEAPILQIVSPSQPTVLIMNVTSGSSVVKCAVRGEKKSFHDSGNMYMKANESTVPCDLMEQLN